MEIKDIKKILDDVENIDYKVGYADNDIFEIRTDDSGDELAPVVELFQCASTIIKQLLFENERLEKNNKYRWYTVFELAKNIELPEVKYYVLKFFLEDDGNSLPPVVAIKDEHDIFIDPKDGVVFNPDYIKSIYPLPENK